MPNTMTETQDYSTAKWEKTFQTLLDQIEHQQCVLLLGPDIARSRGTPIQQQLHNLLREQYQEEISYYYERDGLYLFCDGVAKGDVQGAVRSFYKKDDWQEKLDEAIFKKIAEMPFHLVLSISPDNFLSDVYYKYGVSHRSSFFHHRGDAVPQIDPPTRHTPLFYQLFGRFSQDESLVLDYEDLYKLLEASLGSPGLPEKLRSALQDAKTFLFLGFDFEKWYSQLLLRLLSGGKALRKYALNTQIADPQTNTFLVKQFEIEFLGDEMAFFENLYGLCQKNKLLRELIEPNSPIARKVIQLVRGGEIERAIGELRSLENAEQDIEQLTTGVSARYFELKGRENRKIITEQEYRLEFNRLIDAILELSHLLP